MSKTTSLFVDLETIRLTKEGLWLSNDKEITHAKSLEVFPKIIRRDEKGYFLKLKQETKRIEVEDTAFFVLRIEGNPKQGIELILSNGSKEKLDATTLKYLPERLTCKVKNATEDAKFLRPAYDEFLRFLKEDQKVYYLELEGNRIELYRK